MPEATEQVLVGRVYAPPSSARHLPVLVDRLWPRGLRKVDAPFEQWLPTVAPSTSLRRFYAHRLERFEEFATRYRAELDADEEGGFRDLVALANRQPLALLTATRDLEHSGASVLAEALARRLGDDGAKGPAVAPVVALTELFDRATGRGAIWSLDRRHGVNVNLVRLGPGEHIDPHVNDEVDVVLLGLAGSGVVVVDDEERALVPNSLTLVERGTRRSISAGEGPFGYLSIHLERPGPTIRKRPPRKDSR